MKNILCCKKSVVIIFLVAVMCISAFTACSSADTSAKDNEAKYLEAFELTEKGDYEAAYALFTELGDYKDAVKEAAKFHYAPEKYNVEYIETEGSRTETINLSYNENNLPSQCVRTSGDGYQHTCTFTYDENGRLAKISCLDTDGLTEEYDCFYDQKGNLIKTTYRYTDGVVETYEYTYNENGDQTKMVVSDTTGYYFSQENFYDADGKQINAVIISDNETYTHDYVYDADGNVMKIISKDESGNELIVDDYFYDEKGRHIKTTYIEADTITGFLEYTYNDADQILSERYEYGEDEVYTFFYTYDGNGTVVEIREEEIDNYVVICKAVNKLVYVPFEYSKEEWQRLIDTTKDWTLIDW